MITLLLLTLACTDAPESEAVKSGSEGQAGALQAETSAVSRARSDVPPLHLIRVEDKVKGGAWTVRRDQPALVPIRDPETKEWANAATLTRRVEFVERDGETWLDAYDAEDKLLGSIQAKEPPRD